MKQKALPVKSMALHRADNWKRWQGWWQHVNNSPTKTFIILAFHLATIWQPFVVYLCCLSFTGPHYRSSYTCSQPQLAIQRSNQLHSGFNHAPLQPSHHSPLSIDPSLLPSSSLVGPLPCSSSTLPHINTNIHPSKQTPSCIHNFHCTFTELTN